MTHEHCSSCNSNMTTYTEEEIAAELDHLPEWSYDKEKNTINRSIEFKGFAKTMGFVNAIAWIAQQEKHHPDVSFGYNYVNISFQTHEAGGITDNDLICARQINELLD